MLLTVDGCKTRQQRLVQWMNDQGVDVALITQPSHVYYLTAALPTLNWPMAVIVWADGESVLIDHAQRDQVAADRVMHYEPQALGTIKPDLEAMVGRLVGDALDGKMIRSAAVEYAHGFAYAVDHLDCPTVAVDDQLKRMRRRKDPDEVAVIKRLIAIGNCGYAAARDMMAPGRDELDIYEAIHNAMVTEAGEALTVIGVDFACGQAGGPPRKGRKIQDGELHIFDLGPKHWRYGADSCRTFAVSGKPTDEQHRAWEFVTEALDIAIQMVKPGVRAAEVYDAVKAHLDAYQVGAFPHHLGHGIGMGIHEAPFLNPHFDDVFVEGDVFTAEPGLYTDELRGGLRLEHDLLVTASGVEILTDFPLQMTLQS